MTASRNNPATQTKVEPSITAVSVAMGFMRALDTNFGYLFNPEELKLIKHLVTAGRHSLYGFNWALCEGVSCLPYGMQQSFFNRVAFPYYEEIIMLRKFMIREKVFDAYTRGVNQLVFLGGGYDIRSIISSLSFPKIQVFELDRGPTRENKLKGLKSIPREVGLGDISINETADGTVVINNNLHCIECDLSTDNLLEKLQSNGYVPGLQTLIIAEGLTAYLSESDNQKLLTSLAALLNEGDELLLSYVSSMACSTLASASMQSSKETYQYALPQQNVPSFVASAGYTIAQKFDAIQNLRLLGITAGEYQLREQYYSLRKSSFPDVTQSIDSVPSIDLALPPKPTQSSMNQRP